MSNLKEISFKNKKFIAGTAVMVFITFAIISTIRKTQKTDKLIINAVFTKGRIIECNGISKRYAASIHYKYAIADSIYTGTKTYEINKYKCKELVGKEFTIAYNRTDISSSEILITEQDYSRFYLDYPDSLSWVTRYFQ